MTGIENVHADLRTRLVHLTIHEVRRGNWTPDRAARELRWIGLSASAPRVASAAGLSGKPFAWAVSRLSRPLWSALEADCPQHGEAA